MGGPPRGGRRAAGLGEGEGKPSGIPMQGAPERSAEPDPRKANRAAPPRS
jgi:hypothetical protein